MQFCRRAYIVWTAKLFDVSALKIHMSETAHDAVSDYPEFITEPRGEKFIKVK